MNSLIFSQHNFLNSIKKRNEKLTFSSTKQNSPLDKMFMSSGLVNPFMPTVAFNICCTRLRLSA